VVITLLLTTGIVSFLPLFLQPGDHSEYAFMLRRAMCSGDNSDIHAAHSGRSGALDFLVFVKTRRSFSLGRRRESADFVEQHRRAMSSLKNADAFLHGASESSFDMSEKFALHQGLDERRAIAGNKRAGRNGAQVMKRPCGQLLSRPRFTRNQDRSEVLETSAGSLRNASTTSGSKRRPDSPCMVSRPDSSEDARR